MVRVRYWKQWYLSQHGRSQTLKYIANSRGEIFSKDTLSTSDGDSYIGDLAKNYIQYHHHSKSGRVDVSVVIKGVSLTENHIHENLFDEQDHPFSFYKNNYTSRKSIS